MCDDPEHPRGMRYKCQTGVSRVAAMSFSIRGS